MAAMKGEGRVGLMQISTLCALENLHQTPTTTNFQPKWASSADADCKTAFFFFFFYWEGGGGHFYRGVLHKLADQLLCVEASLIEQQVGKRRGDGFLETGRRSISETCQVHLLKEETEEVGEAWRPNASATSRKILILLPKLSPAGRPFVVSTCKSNFPPFSCLHSSLLLLISVYEAFRGELFFLEGGGVQLFSQYTTVLFDPPFFFSPVRLI